MAKETTDSDSDNPFETSSESEKLKEPPEIDDIPGISIAQETLKSEDEREYEYIKSVMEGDVNMVNVSEEIETETAVNYPLEANVVIHHNAETDAPGESPMNHSDTAILHTEPIKKILDPDMDFVEDSSCSESIPIIAGGLSSQNGSQLKKAKKPKRPCLFCGQFKSDIRSHLLTSHRNEDRVKSLASMDDKERCQALAVLRKKGILKRNKEILASGGANADLLCERESEGLKVVCSKCSGTFNEKYFRKHKQNCNSPTKKNMARPLKTIQDNTERASEFDKVVERMRTDEIHDIIKSDPGILLIGKHIFDSRKPLKNKEAKKNCCTAMRRLARLVKAIDKVNTLEEIFLVENVYFLEQGIQDICKADEVEKKDKSGLRVALGSLIRLSAKVLVTNHLIMKKHDKAQEIEQFERVFNMKYTSIFCQAEYQLKEKRQRENRKPLALPDEADLSTLRKYLTEEIQSSVSSLSESDSSQHGTYCQLRRVTLSRVTLLNGRRGSEASRMLTQDFLERDLWITERDLDKDEKQLLKQYALVYVMGKGNSLVPVLIPNDCVEAMNLLIDSNLRKSVGVKADNHFVFAYTQDSDDCSTGYNEVYDVCHKIGIPVINATAIRHRTSTMFWKLEGTDPKTIATFMNHMGHSEEIDRNIYSVPPALNTLKTMAPIIAHLDQEDPCTGAKQKYPRNKRAIKENLPVGETESDGDIASSEDEYRPHNHQKKVGETDSDIASSEDEYGPHNHQKKELPMKRWHTNETEMVLHHFRSYVDGSKGNVYPGKQELQNFLQSKEIDTTWKKLKTKLFNEKAKFQLKMKKITR